MSFDASSGPPVGGHRPSAAFHRGARDCAQIEREHNGRLHSAAQWARPIDRALAQALRFTALEPVASVGCADEATGWLIGFCVNGSERANERTAERTTERTDGRTNEGGKRSERTGDEGAKSSCAWLAENNTAASSSAFRPRASGRLKVARMKSCRLHWRSQFGAGAYFLALNE